MAEVCEQHPSTEATNFINQHLSNIHSEDNRHFATTLFESYEAALNNQLKENWKITNPKFWSSEDVLDWLFHIGEENDVDFKNFSAESFQCLKGEDLILMFPQEFYRREPIYGELIYTCLSRHLNTPKMEPSSCEAILSEKTNIYKTIREIMFPEFEDYLSSDQTHEDANLNQRDNVDNFTVNNNLPPLQLPTTSDQFQPECALNQIPSTFEQPKIECQIDEEEDCDQKLSYTTLTNNWNSDSKPQIPPHVTKLEDNNLHISHISQDSSFPKQVTENVSSSSRKPTKCKQQSSPSKEQKTKKTRSGNHLWEFIRDLLHNDQYNPSYIKWEDHKNGIFRLVASEMVAKLWGIKKHNSSMNYEKLSRAMRFSRSVGYFIKLPENGLYPKKLCFQFGPKAFGWEKK